MFTKTSLHAVRALMFLAELDRDQSAGVNEIARRIGAPPQYLNRLLGALAHDGLVERASDQVGGYRLARLPEHITLMEVVSPIEQADRWSNCLLGKLACSERNPCAIHEQWKSVRQVYLQFLTDTSVADLIQEVTPGAPAMLEWCI